MTIGQIIKDLRDKKGMTQEELSRALGKKNKQVLSNWETDKNEPSLTDLAKIAELFGVSADYLVFGKEPSAQSGELNVDIMRELVDSQKKVIELTEELRKRESVDRQRIVNENNRLKNISDVHDSP